MTDEQKAAFVNAQTACALAEIAAMQAANSQFPQDQPYDEKAFLAVPDKYVIGHNAVVGLFHS
jgi:hypothetical protein